MCALQEFAYKIDTGCVVSHIPERCGITATAVNEAAPFPLSPGFSKPVRYPLASSLLGSISHGPGKVEGAVSPRLMLPLPVKILQESHPPVLSACCNAADWLSIVPVLYFWNCRTPTTGLTERLQEGRYEGELSHNEQLC